MTDDEIRAVVRSAIERHLGVRPPVAGQTRQTLPETPMATPVHMSFERYTLTRAADDTMCLIEPAVRCNHCGYCQCHGH
jgi:hypothetical protein